LKKFAGRSIVVGIRTEDLHAANSVRSGSILVGDVHPVEALGAEIIVQFRMDDPIVQLDDSSVTVTVTVTVTKSLSTTPRRRWRAWR